MGTLSTETRHELLDDDPWRLAAIGCRRVTARGDRFGGCRDWDGIKNGIVP
ncbi:MAG: hypothetical protein ABEJ58_08285 [Halodesulfurarchaeum sp.]